MTKVGPAGPIDDGEDRTGSHVPQPWIGRAPDAPYFRTEDGETWTPIGQNDSISWLELSGLVGQRDLAGVRRHLQALKACGVTVLRLMLEYAEDGDFFFETPGGDFNPAMVQLWDDLFGLVEAVGLRILLTPMDTYFHWVRWDIHPWNQANGGPCAERVSLMVHPGVRARIKARLEFATRRWGGSGALFAWDLWNEMHPVQGEDRPGCLEDYINDVAPWLRALEVRVHGRAHLQTVSVFGPELHWKPWLNAPVFRHGALDFANNHFYEEGTIDHPADTVAPALAAAKLVREALAEIVDGRPFFETEHGPIHSFKDHKVILPEPFDDEYFRHIQWAHLASGGAGGGMRWPNRHPHQLTPGMRAAQRALAGFLPAIDWQVFRRRGVEVACDDPAVAVIACADERQAVFFLLRTGLSGEGRVDATVRAGPSLGLPFAGTARFYDPVAGCWVGAGRGGVHSLGDDGGLKPTLRTGCVVRAPDFGACLVVAALATVEGV